jgi:hypothetical protein
MAWESTAIITVPGEGYQTNLADDGQKIPQTRRRLGIRLQPRTKTVATKWVRIANPERGTVPRETASRHCAFGLF